MARQETANPGGSDSDIAYGFLMSRNVVDWTTAGQLHLEQTANLWWNGNPQWQKEVGAYLDQTGFNPFGIGVPAMGGAAGKVSAKALMNALKAGELPKGEVAPGKANLPTIGALADAEAGMPYTHPVKPAVKSVVDDLGGVSSKITELPKATRNSPRNIQTDQSASDAIKNLVSAGFKNTPSKDGTVNVLTKGDKTYTFYSRSKTTGLPSAELKIGGNSKKNIAVKIRFENP